MVKQVSVRVQLKAFAKCLVDLQDDSVAFLDMREEAKMAAAIVVAAVEVVVAMVVVVQVCGRGYGGAWRAYKGLGEDLEVSARSFAAQEQLGAAHIFSTHSEVNVAN